jgi:quinoprotein glucose dehydrogenase
MPPLSTSPAHGRGFTLRCPATVIAGFLLAVLISCQTPLDLPSGGPTADWPNYGNDPGGSRFSPLTQITPDNVNRLEIAWTYHTGDVSEGGEGAPATRATTFEATPILVDNTLYVCTGFARAVALDAETGAERWTFDPKIDLSLRYSDFACRGVSAWLDPERAVGQACRRRIFLAHVGARLHALDAATGKPCQDFGKNGEVDLSEGIEPFNMVDYGVTSPPVVIGGLVVVGSAIGDNQLVEDASGMVRAFDARTGALRWAWDPIPRDPRDPARATWAGDSASRNGGSNAWSILSADPERDLVFVPTSSPTPDFAGTERLGNNSYSDSVVALRASTGQVVWSFQTVHHNLWDYDVASQPTLITVKRDGREIPAVAQATKMGMVFFLHRETGEPLFPLEERPVPPSTIPGERASPTQPFPVKPPPLVPHSLTPDQAWGLTPWDRGKCHEILEGLDYKGIFTPPSVRGTLIFPGNAGGSNWGSVAFDPGRGLLVANTSVLAHMVQLIPRAEYAAVKAANPNIEISRQEGTGYGMKRQSVRSPWGLPCNPPPWGTLAAIDVNTGEIRWQHPLGTTRDLAPVPIAFETGTPNMGGPVVTATGLVFIGAAMDNYLRAFDVETGDELWKGRLPAGGQATPMTYRLRPGGKQFVVIAAGGHGRMGTKLGDAVVAFALP